MLFPTLGFLLFFLIVAAAMAALGTRFAAKKTVLVVASYYFYAQWDWRFCFLLAGSSVVSYVAGQLIDRASDERRARTILGIAVALHLGLLGIFKYFDFFISSANQLARLLGLEHEVPFTADRPGLGRTARPDDPRNGRRAPSRAPRDFQIFRFLYFLGEPAGAAARAR